ncbi:DUF4387 domain-containing protein [Fusibacter sp. 3D3]|uniref:DUF4387 domain-containing protein n=1 Tax=Fusibacter sp. 3D3 TaxID=1048380 RepID=UPI0008531FB4|nr:DUF4387 domain-containing protein [Fusibacter sp. 3D3]GAU77193.1 hypothetical protein F3D3_1807 [Fusibacter sp. 3D3]
MTKLVELAKVLRSKNSGPFEITLDILFEDVEVYKRVACSGVISSKAIAALYQLEEEEITNIVFFKKALGIKITYSRKISSGTVGDRDVYGAQQHAPLMDLLIP